MKIVNKVIISSCFFFLTGGCSPVTEGTGADENSTTGSSSTTSESTNVSPIPTTSNETTGTETTFENITETTENVENSTTIITTSVDSESIPTSSDSSNSETTMSGSEICGNGIVEGLEQCDDSGESSSCDLDCTFSECMDGYKNISEECDDGDLDNTNLCNNNCIKSRFMFLTSDYIGGVGGFGGVKKADDICQKDADKFGLQGSYKAWLNDSKDNLITNLNSQSFEGWYLLPKNQNMDFYIPIADGWNELVNGEIDNAINTIANGTKQPEASMVWTNTFPDGHLFASDTNCGNWTVKEASNQGGVGISSSTGPQWTNAGTQSCDKGGKLYCIQVGD